MKEATGELNVTVITVVAIAAVAALFMTVIYPKIKNNINDSVNSTASYCYDKDGNIVDCSSSKAIKGNSGVKKP